MAESRATTIRFAEGIYRRLEQAGEATGLPINSIVVVACLEWLDAHQQDQAPATPAAPTAGHRTFYPFDRFTERGKLVLTLAQQAAERANTKLIGPEHVLLGLLIDGQGLAATALNNLGLDLAGASAAIQNAPTAREGKVPNILGHAIPRSSVKAIIERVFQEAERMHMGFVGTEHLLLGLVEEADGIAAGVLAERQITVDRTRQEIDRLLTDERKTEN
jgi:ATP-dependent Clp protease ATP-binding subunit ClpC